MRRVWLVLATITLAIVLAGGVAQAIINGEPDQRTIAGVTSFGIAPLCRGPGYYQRVDLPRVLKWVHSFP